MSAKTSANQNPLNPSTIARLMARRARGKSKLQTPEHKDKLRLNLAKARQVRSEASSARKTAPTPEQPKPAPSVPQDATSLL